MLLVGFFINELFLRLDYNSYIKFLENNFTPYYDISDPSFLIFKIHLTFTLYIIIFMILNYIQMYKFSNLTILDKVGYPTTFVLLIMCSFYGYITDLMSINNYLYSEDGFLEWMTAIFALISSVLFLLSINSREGSISLLIKLIMFFMFLCFGMEEISWGQRIFGWETPAGFTELNHQNETNIHNIFSPYFTIIYLVFNLCIAIFLFISSKLTTENNLLVLQNYKHALPSPKFMLFGFIFIFLAIKSNNELTEEVFSVFGLMYATDQFQISNKKYKDLDKVILLKTY